jgi:hypothetical protein
MKHPKVLSFKQFPTRPPITQTLVVYLMMDKFHAPGWLWGVVITLWVIIWATVIYMMAVQESTEIAELK